jgi:hypothetical protein
MPGGAPLPLGGSEPSLIAAFTASFQVLCAIFEISAASLHWASSTSVSWRISRSTFRCGDNTASKRQFCNNGARYLQTSAIRH